MSFQFCVLLSMSFQLLAAHIYHHICCVRAGDEEDRGEGGEGSTGTEDGAPARRTPAEAPH